MEASASVASRRVNQRVTNLVCVCQVTQVMLGLMVMSYSIPLHFTEVTEVVSLGVPWWSGLTVSVCMRLLCYLLGNRSAYERKQLLSWTLHIVLKCLSVLTDFPFPACVFGCMYVYVFVRSQFIAAGTVAIILDKYSTMKTVSEQTHTNMSEVFITAPENNITVCLCSSCSCPGGSWWNKTTSHEMLKCCVSLNHTRVVIIINSITS